MMVQATQKVVYAYASVGAVQGPDEVYPRPSKRMVIGKTIDASPTISVWLRPVKSNVEASAASIVPLRLESVNSRKDVLLRISTRDMSSQLAGRRLTESYLARSRATLNSRDMFCRSRLDADAPNPITASVTNIPITIKTMNSSINEKPASLR